MIMKRTLSLLAILPLLYTCEPAPVSAQNLQPPNSDRSIHATIGTMSGSYNGEYVDGYVGQIIQAKGNRF